MDAWTCLPGIRGPACLGLRSPRNRKRCLSRSQRRLFLELLFPRASLAVRGACSKSDPGAARPWKRWGQPWRAPPRQWASQSAQQGTSRPRASSQLPDAHGSGSLLPAGPERCAGGISVMDTPSSSSCFAFHFHGSKNTQNIKLAILGFPW